MDREDIIKMLMASRGGGLGVGSLMPPGAPPPLMPTAVPKSEEPKPSVGSLIAAGLLGGLGGFMGQPGAGAQYAEQWRKRQDHMAQLLQQQQQEQRISASKFNPALQALMSPGSFVLGG